MLTIQLVGSQLHTGTYLAAEQTFLTFSHNFSVLKVETYLKVCLCSAHVSKAQLLLIIEMGAVD